MTIFRKVVAVVASVVLPIGQDGRKGVQDGNGGRQADEDNVRGFHLEPRDPGL